MRPFIHYSGETDDKEIPIIVPYAAAAYLLGLDDMSSGADASQKLERLRYLSQKAVGKEFAVCYRNDISRQQIDQALDKEANSQAAVSYALPSEDSCGAATVQNDKRGIEERTVEQRQRDFASRFGSRC
jgi:hypothetical protein